MEHRPEIARGIGAHEQHSVGKVKASGEAVRRNRRPGTEPFKVNDLPSSQTLVGAMDK
jgi:hypothetical protein